MSESNNLITDTSSQSDCLGFDELGQSVNSTSMPNQDGRLNPGTDLDLMEFLKSSFAQISVSNAQLEAKLSAEIVKLHHDFTDLKTNIQTEVTNNTQRICNLEQQNNDFVNKLDNLSEIQNSLSAQITVNSELLNSLTSEESADCRHICDLESKIKDVCTKEFENKQGSLLSDTQFINKVQQICHDEVKKVKVDCSNDNVTSIIKEVCLCEFKKFCEINNLKPSSNSNCLLSVGNSGLHDIFSKSHLLNSLGIFTNELGALNPQLFIHRLENLINNHVTWSQLKLVLVSHLADESLTWYNAHELEFQTFNDFKTGFLRRFWNFAKQQSLKQEIMGTGDFAKAGKDLLNYVNVLKYKNSFLSNPFSDEDLINYCIQHLPFNIQYNLAQADFKTFCQFEDALQKCQLVLDRQHSIRRPNNNNNGNEISGNNARAANAYVSGPNSPCYDSANQPNVRNVRFSGPNDNNISGGYRGGAHNNRNQSYNRNNSNNFSRNSFNRERSPVAPRTTQEQPSSNQPESWED